MACSFIVVVVCLFVFFWGGGFISSILSSFSNASSLGRRLDILKYCGIGRYNPTVVVSYRYNPTVVVNYRYNPAVVVSYYRRHAH